MKKRKVFNKILSIILVLICISIIPVISFGLIKFFDYENYDDIDDTEISNDNVLSDEEIDRIAASRRWKRKIMEMEDGWYYFLSMERLEIEVGSYKYSAYLDGCNIKYETLDDNYKLFIDESGNENHDLSTPPFLGFSYKSKDGKKNELDELREINDFFGKKKWYRKIGENDLDSLDLVNFKTKDIVKIWNDTYDLEFNHDVGHYNKFSECSYFREDKKSNYYQLGLILNYGRIDVVRIDYVDKEGMYLTDKIDNGIASKKEQYIYDNIQLIEKEIEKNGILDLGDKFNDLKKNNDYKDLFILFEKVNNKHNEIK